MKYRKKPVVIDTVQWTGANKREMFDFLTDYQCTDQYMSAEGKNFYIDHWKVPGGLVIKTLEGEHLANIGDYIIRGVHGEFYPCKPDTYDVVIHCKSEDEQKKVIEHLKSISWIPVSERLPEKHKDVIATVKYSGFCGMYGKWLKTASINDYGEMERRMYRR